MYFGQLRILLFLGTQICTVITLITVGRNTMHQLMTIGVFMSPLVTTDIDGVTTIIL